MFKATDKDDPSIKVAIKVINKHEMTEDDLEGLKNEVKLMQTVDHSNIVKYYETYDDKRYIYLVMELLTGGELFDDVVQTGKPMSEKVAAGHF